MAAQLRSSLGLVDLGSRVLTVPVAQALRATLTASYAIRIPAALSLLGLANALPVQLPNLWGDIWGSILRAVPKKKTSHRKKRQRFLVGKALKDEIALNKCPACGTIKKAHFLCPWCVKEIQDMWKGKEPKVESNAEAK